MFEISPKKTCLGFGDVSPAHPEYMMATFGIVMVGLALVSVCINVITDQLARLYMKLLQKMLQVWSIIR